MKSWRPEHTWYSRWCATKHQPTRERTGDATDFDRMRSDLPDTEGLPIQVAFVHAGSSADSVPTYNLVGTFHRPRRRGYTARPRPCEREAF